MHKDKKFSSGFTLIQTTVSLGIVLISLLTTANLITYYIRMSAATEAKVDIREMTTEIRSILGTSESCTANLSPYLYDKTNSIFITSGAEVKLAYLNNGVKGTPLIVANRKYGNLVIENVKFKHVTSYSPQRHLAEIEVKFRSIRKPFPFESDYKPLKILVPVETKQSNQQIIDRCVLEDTVAQLADSQLADDVCRLMNQGSTKEYTYDPVTDACVVLYELKWISGGKYSASCGEAGWTYNSCSYSLSADSCPAGSFCPDGRVTKDGKHINPKKSLSRCGPKSKSGIAGAYCKWAKGAEGTCKVSCRKKT